jgi:HEPN domain-containing protein
MKLPNPAVLEKVKQWLAYADEDLHFAQHGFSMPEGPPSRVIAFHAQQCAEKYLKAYLIFHIIDFPYTHDIAQLLEMCAAHARWTGELEDAEELTPYAITARYPGEDEEVGEAEARRAVEAAVRVRETVKRSLRDEGFEISR